MKTKLTMMIPVFALACAGCGEKSGSSAVPSEAADASGLAAVFLDSAPADAKAIHVARVDAKPGEELVLSGRVMGAMEPFVSGRAAFILGDPEKITPCNERPDDECETPWDVCCDSKEAIHEGTATIQVLGDDGRVMKAQLEGVAGLDKLSRVVIKGTVADISTADVLVVNASGIYVER